MVSIDKCEMWFHPIPSFASFCFYLFCSTILCSSFTIVFVYCFCFLIKSLACLLTSGACCTKSELLILLEKSYII